MEQNAKLIKKCGICIEDATCLCFQCKKYFCQFYNIVYRFLLFHFQLYCLMK